MRESGKFQKTTFKGVMDFLEKGALIPKEDFIFSEFDHIGIVSPMQVGSIVTDVISA